MGKTRHEESYVDFDKPYERNLIGLRGVIYFAVGLFLLVVITFGLMAFLLNVLDTEAEKADVANRNPMQLSEKERLPSEPRLQSAPGFQVQTADGQTINLELKHPQAEWEILEKEYEKLWKDGQKANDGTYTVLPIEQAKEKYLQQRGNAPAANQPQGNILEESNMFMSDSSAGRLATVKRR